MANRRQLGVGHYVAGSTRSLSGYVASKEYRMSDSVFGHPFLKGSLTFLLGVILIITIRAFLSGVLPGAITGPPASDYCTQQGGQMERGICKIP